MQKKKAVLRFLLLILAVSITGCGVPGSAENTAGAMGASDQTQYTETEITPQGGIDGRPVDFWVTEDGRLLYGAYDGENVTIYESKDRGVSWKTHTIRLINAAKEEKTEESNRYSRGIPVLTPGGEVFDWADKAGEADTFLLERYDKSGNRTEMEFRNPQGSATGVQPQYIESAKALSEDRLLLSYMQESGGSMKYGILHCKTGDFFEIPQEIWIDGNVRVCLCSIFAGVQKENVVLPDGEGSILRIDLDGQKTEVLVRQEEIKKLKAFAVSGDAFYFMTDQNEVLRKNEAEEPEKLLNGQNSYALPEYDCTLLRAENDGTLYIAAYGTEETRIFRYRHETAQPRTPFRVVSLYRSGTTAAAVSRFAAEHPDMQMTYEALEETLEGQTTQDMLRALHTELLSDSGPDVLILDGLPIAQYIKQGLLTQLDALVDTDDIYPTLLETLKQNGKVYFVPVKFSVPLLFGPQEELAGLTSPQALLEKIKAYSDQNPYIESTNTETTPPPADRCDPIAMQLCIFDGGDWKREDDYGWGNGAAFDLWYQLYQTSLLKENVLNQEQLECFFTQLKEVVSYYDIPLDNRLWYIDNQFTAGGGCVGASLASYTAGYSKIGYAELDDFGILAYGLGFKDSKAALLNAVQQGLYEPKVMAGIPAGCKQPQRAAAFIQLLLQENDAYYVREGCPATRAGTTKRLEALACEKKRNAEPEETDVKTYYEIKYYKPITKEEIEILTAALKTPILKERLLEETLLEAARGYCTGDWSLEETVKKTEQKMRIWLAEQE